jgi:hypothetical protein
MGSLGRHTVATAKSMFTWTPFGITYIRLYLYPNYLGTQTNPKSTKNAKTLARAETVVWTHLCSRNLCFFLIFQEFRNWKTRFLKIRFFIFVKKKTKSNNSAFEKHDFWKISVFIVVKNRKWVLESFPNWWNSWNGDAFMTHLGTKPMALNALQRQDNIISLPFIPWT